MKSYGEPRVLLENKLGELRELGDLENISGHESLIYGISELLNAMTELEDGLYHPRSGLGKVKQLMGETRRYKFIKKT